MKKNILNNPNNILRVLWNTKRHFTEENKIILLGSLIILLSLFSVLFTNSIIPSSNSVSALSYQSSELISFTFAPTVQITISDNLTIPSLSPGDGKDSNIITVTASSNAMSGYTLSSTVGDSTTYPTNELRKDGTNTTYKFSSITTNTPTLSDFSDNEWGYSYSTDSGTTWQSGDITGTPTSGYNGLPLYTTESPITLINSNDASTNSVQFKIGARAASTQVAGEYTNVVNFIGLARPNPTYITLDQATYMQDDFSCVATPVGTTKKLIDNRDGQEYLVARLLDGKCWMLDNLRLDPTNQTTATNMNETNTNATNEAINNYLNGSETAPETGWSSKAVVVAPGGDITNFNSYTEPRVNLTHINDTTTGYGPGSKIGGVYYNYCAATVGTYCYEENAAPAVNASYDMCPANWRMPTGGSNGEYFALCKAIGGGTCNTSISGTDPDSLQARLSTPLSGLYDGTGVGLWGSRGYFWSSTRSGGNYMYVLVVYSSSVNPQYNSTRYFGFSMRCVVNN